MTVSEIKVRRQAHIVYEAIHKQERSEHEHCEDGTREGEGNLGVKNTIAAVRTHLPKVGEIYVQNTPVIRRRGAWFWEGPMVYRNLQYVPLLIKVDILIRA